MKKYTNRIKLMPKFTKCMSLAMILTFTGYEEAFAEMSYAEQTSFTVSMENQTLKSVINWVEKNSQFIFIYRTDIDLSRRVNVDVRNKTIEEVLKQMFAGTDLEYHIRDRQVIIRKAISREETRPIVMQQDKVTVHDQNAFCFSATGGIHRQPCILGILNHPLDRCRIGTHNADDLIHINHIPITDIYQHFISSRLCHYSMF